MSSALDEMGQEVVRLGALLTAADFATLVAKWDAACAAHAKEVATLEDRVDELESGIRELADARERHAQESPARMWGGAPFPAIVTTGELRGLLSAE